MLNTNSAFSALLAAWTKLRGDHGRARPQARVPDRGSAAVPPRLGAVAWPLFAELCLGLLVGVVGTWLAARLGDAAGAAFALSNHVLAMLFVLFRVVGAGVGVVVAQSLGRSQPEQARQLAFAALGAATWLGLTLAVVAALGAAPLLRLLGAPPEVVAPATRLLWWLAPALLLDAWLATLCGVARAHLRGPQTLAAVLLMHATHLGLALCLMHSAAAPWASSLGLPALGLAGYAVAMLASRCAALAFMLRQWRHGLLLRPRWRHLVRLPRPELRALLRVGGPGAAENIAYRACFMVSVGVVAGQGSAALATHAYTTQISSTVMAVGVALGLGVELVAGHLVGAGQLHAAHRLVRQALALGLVLAFTLTTLVALAGPQLLAVFTQDPAIVARALPLLWLTVLLELGRTCNLVLVNALRAVGDVRYPFMAGVGSMVLVLGLGSWCLGSEAGMGWGLPGLWLAYAADEALRGALMWRRWAGLRWVGAARAVHRLKFDNQR